MPRKVDPITITTEEVEMVKGQVLQGLRQKYLRFKAEWIAVTANSKTTEIDVWKKQMDEVITAYKAVETDL